MIVVDLLCVQQGALGKQAPAKHLCSNLSLASLSVCSRHAFCYWTLQYCTQQYTISTTTGRSIIFLLCKQVSFCFPGSLTKQKKKKDMTQVGDLKNIYRGNKNSRGALFRRIRNSKIGFGIGISIGIVAIWLLSRQIHQDVVLIIIKDEDDDDDSTVNNPIEESNGDKNYYNNSTISQKNYSIPTATNRRRRWCRIFLSNTRF